MRVDLFDFVLPEDRIADRPAVPRETARLLNVTPQGFADYRIGDLPDLLKPGDVLVLNDTRVIPARLFGTRETVTVELLLYRQQDDGTWLSLAKPAKRLKAEDRIIIGDNFVAHVVGRTEDGSVQLRFNCSDQEFTQALKHYGHTSLPPYVKRPDDAQDRNDYQTVYAKHDGAVAAPTAGLHFTPDLMGKLKDRGIDITYLTLHVGLGTFLPVTADDTHNHVMHHEWGQISDDVAAKLAQAKENGQRIVAAGTTSLRLIESAADGTGHINPFRGLTDLFIVPGFRFNAVDVLMTNFHLPKSTLFMLVSAFAGLEKMKAAYQHAIDNGYRFYSYGDACLLEREQGP